jgi:hypothetical protein
MGNEPLLLAGLAKRWISSRDIDDATFLPKMTESDQWLYAMPPLSAGFEQAHEKPG